VRPTRPDTALLRRRARRRGRVAEWLCLWHLRLRGWQIVERRWRCPSGEIDILARRGRVLAVVEVKSRREAEAAALALAPRQRRRIIRAAEAFLVSRPDLAPARTPIRPDVGRAVSAPATLAWRLAGRQLAARQRTERFVSKQITAIAGLSAHPGRRRGVRHPSPSMSVNQLRRVRIGSILPLPDNDIGES
jgi:putative endonuclease